jgi:osmotically inducible lipoprotein OsmB
MQVFPNLQDKETVMRNLRMSLAIASLFALSACASMTSTEKGTLGGAAIGGIAGAALTGGSALGTVGGAAVGGVIGHEIGENRDRRRGY